MKRPGGLHTGVKNGGTVRTLRNGLVLVVVSALLPMSILSIWQGRAAWNDARVLAANQLRIKAWLIAEGERDAFDRARQSLQFAKTSRSVKAMDAQCSTFLAETLTGTSGVLNLVRTDASGRVRCSALPFKGTERFAAEDWWQRASKMVGLTLSKPAMGQISKKYAFRMALRMDKPDGSFDGTISAAVDVNELRASFTRRRAVDPTALIELVDASGATVSGDKRFKFNASAEASAGGLPTATVAGDGTEWLYATAPLHGKDLTIVYGRRTNDVLSAARSQVRQSVILPLVAMLLASLAIWTGTHWLVVRWLRKLQDLTAQFAMGDYSGNSAAYIKAPREVALLSDDLHMMADTINQRNIALNNALTAKTALTREVNHRVKNNLQIVTSLLTLQADRVADAYARDALGQARARIAALGLIHRVLYESDAHSSLAMVDMSLLMDELCPQLRASNRSHRDVELKCKCDAFEVTVDQAVPLTLLIVEVVTNAFRHAYPDERDGNIAVNLTEGAGHITLSIADDGAGYSLSDPIGKMGFELINAFATQLGAVVDISSDATGTRLSLRCALAPSRLD